MIFYFNVVANSYEKTNIDKKGAPFCREIV